MKVIKKKIGFRVKGLGSFAVLQKTRRSRSGRWDEEKGKEEGEENGQRERGGT